MVLELIFGVLIVLIKVRYVGNTALERNILTNVQHWRGRCNSRVVTSTEYSVLTIRGELEPANESGRGELASLWGQYLVDTLPILVPNGGRLLRLLCQR